MSSKPEVVVSGIGGIFPKCINLDDYMDLLLQNKSAAEQAKWIESGKERTFYNNFPENRHQHFDPSFFGVHYSQAFYFDPMIRLLMETSFEAIIDAGLNPADVSGRTIPVIFATAISEANSFLFDGNAPGFGVTGQARTMAANRVSYYLNVNGPSEVVDKNWTGGVQAIEDAVRMIESGVCEAALVGASNLSTGSSINDIMKTRGIISKDGKTKPYTEQADGYCRGDAVVVLFLQRATDAKRNYATLLYANTLFNGNKENEYLDLNLDFLEKFLQDCYNNCGIDPKDVSYLEADGCGLKNIDEVELAAVERVFCKNRKTPLQIGSVKTNIGHTEPASALVSLIKVIIAMETGILPAHLNFALKDTKIPALVNGKLEVVTKNREWNGEIAAINCLGLSPACGHMIVRRNQQKNSNPVTDLPYFLYYSTRTEEGILEINKNLSLQPLDFGYSKLVQDAFSKTISGHLYRGYTVKSSQIKQGFQHFPDKKPPVWFVYSGMGSQWKTMGRDLMKIPVFAESVNKSHKTLESKGVDLLKIITEDDPQIFENILNSFVGIAAVQIGLTDVLESIGVVPDGLIGHSVGELGCAYADKCLTAEQMILCAYYRGKASLDANLIAGMMAAVGMGYSELKKLCPDSVEIACHNSADSCTISGPAEDVKTFVDILKSTGVFARLVNVSNIAYHSRYIKPAAPLLLSYIKDIIPHPKERSKKWISTSIPQKLWKTDLAKKVSPEYLTNNLLSSVLFEEGLSFIPDSAILIEVAPHGLLQAILKRALPKEVINIPLTKRETNCMEFLFNSLGELYINGIDLNTKVLYPEVPSPVPRGTRSLCNLVHWSHGFKWDLIAFAFGDTREKSFIINSNENFILTKNRIDSKIVVPFSMFFGYIIDLVNKDDDVRIMTMEDIVFENSLEMSPDDSARVTIMYQPGTGHFEVFLEEVRKLILSGTVIVNDDEKVPSTSVENNKEISVIKAHHFYKDLNIKGYDYPKEYKLVSEVAVHGNGFNATIEHTEDIKAFLNSTLQIHLFNGSHTSNQILLPKYIRQIHVKFEDFKNSKGDHSVWYNNLTGIIGTNCGLHITGIEYSQIMTNYIPVKLENLEFIPHSDEQLQDLSTGLNMLTKIVIESTYTEDLVIVELKEKHTQKYSSFIEKYLQMKNVKAEISEINDINSDKIGKSFLTIISGQFLNVISQILPKVNNYCLLCFRNDQSISISKKYITVANFCNKNRKFYLVKQANVTKVKVINIDDKKLSYKSMQTYLWATELKTKANDKKKIYVVCRSIPTEGIEEFVRKMKGLSDEAQEFRYLFVLDSGAPECKPESEFYANVFEQDLIVQVLKNGSWGNYIDMSIKFEDPSRCNILSCAVNSSDLLKICKPIYVGFHLNDLTRSSSNGVPNEIGALSYSGINEKGHQIMGFGQFDIEQHKLTTDPEFVWPVPTGWTLSDAATVPYAYTLAYYSLFIVADLHADDIILIHGGVSEIGLAALYLARHSGHHVYTTVETDVQKKYLKDVLKLMDLQILDSSCVSYMRKILQTTDGDGVQVILNCLPGKDNIETCKRLLSTHGRIVQLATSALSHYDTIGMADFNRGIHFHGLTGQRLLQLPQDDKLQLRQMVKDGIKNKHIQPLSRTLIEENELDDGLRYLRKNSSIGAVLTKLSENYDKIDDIKNSSEIIRSQGSYLIYADSSDAWAYLVNWLIKKGAKQIMIANLGDKNHDFMKQYITLTKKKHNVEVIVSKNDASTIQNAKNLISDAANLGSLNGTFILAMSEDTGKNEKFVGNIHESLYQIKNQGRIVIFLGRNKEKSYIEKNGLNICNIAWNSAYTLQVVIKNLEMILKKNSTDIYLKDDTVQEQNEVENLFTEDYSMFLPSSLKTLKQLSHTDLVSPKIIKLLHKPRNHQDLPPLFIVPGLSGPYSSSLRKFVNQLLYPVYCISLPASKISDNIVEILAKQIINTDSPKVYRVIGIYWGGILALEIAKKLESYGKRIEVYLIDAVPQIITDFTNNFYEHKEFNSNLLRDITKIDGESIEDILSSDLSKVDYKDIIRSLTVLKNHIEYIKFYKPLENKIRGPVTVILPESTSQTNIGLAEHSEQFCFKKLKLNRRNILQNKNIIDYLHESLDIVFV